MAEEQVSATNTVESDMTEVQVPLVDAPSAGTVEKYYPALADHFLKHPREHGKFLGDLHIASKNIDSFIEDSKDIDKTISLEKDIEKKAGLVKDEVEKCTSQFSSFAEMTSVSDTIREASSVMEAIRTGKILNRVKSLLDGFETKQREDYKIQTYAEWADEHTSSISMSKANNCKRLANKATEIVDMNIAFLGTERLLAMISAAYEIIIVEKTIKKRKKQVPTRKYISLGRFFEIHDITIPDTSNRETDSVEDFKLDIDVSVSHTKLTDKGFEGIEKEIVKQLLVNDIDINKALIERMREADDPRQYLLELLENLTTPKITTPANIEINEMVKRLVKKIESAKQNKELEKEKVNKREAALLSGLLNGLQ